MADVIIESKKNEKILHLSGELVVDQAVHLESALLDILADSEHIGVDLSSVTNVDVACLQLFCAAHKSSVRGNKTLKLHGVCPDAVTRIAKDAGFGRVCGLEAGDTCLWSEAPNA